MATDLFLLCLFALHLKPSQKVVIIALNQCRGLILFIYDEAPASIKEGQEILYYSVNHSGSSKCHNCFSLRAGVTAWTERKMDKLVKRWWTQERCKVWSMTMVKPIHQELPGLYHLAQYKKEWVELECITANFQHGSTILIVLWTLH